jgi:hypothetical protein
MILEPNKEKDFMAQFANTVDWSDGTVVLNQNEVNILRTAYAICEQAHQMTCAANHDVDDFNTFGEASNALNEILEDYKELS